MPVTLREIAREVGVATSTVSRVLSGKTDGTPITEKCIARILDAARRLNYRTNISARAIRTGRTECIAVLLNRDSSYITADVLAKVHDAIDERRLHLALARVSDDWITNEAHMPRLLREFVADGVLVHYPDYVPQGMAELLRQYAVPAIWMNTKRRNDCVYPDDFGAAVRATEHLLKLGHQRIAYCDYSHGPDEPGMHYSAHDRQAGYEHAMRQAGLAPRVFRGHILSAERRAHAAQWLRQSERPTGLLTNGGGASTPILCAAMELGLSAPKDFSVVTFDVAQDAILGQPLTVFTLPFDEVAKTSVDLVVQKIGDPQRTFEPQAKPFGFVDGATCGPPPDAGSTCTGERA